MPLDRRITISWGTGDDAVSRAVWAEKEQGTVSRGIAVEGVYGVGERTYRIRWWRELMAAAEAGQTITVTDAGSALTVTGVGEYIDGGRRRFQDIVTRGRT